MLRAAGQPLLLASGNEREHLGRGATNMLRHAHVECRRCCLSPTMWEHVGSGASHEHVEGSGCCRLASTVYKWSTLPICAGSPVEA